jgi:hypothetical protein
MDRRTIADALARARTRTVHADLVGEAELYCESQGCALRTVTIEFKEYDCTVPPALSCPSCRRQLKLHHAWTLEEAQDAAEREARCSVNIQRHRRDHPGTFAVPLGVFLDESLP